VCVWRVIFVLRLDVVRCSEFVMSEIEHFVNPNDKRHSKFAEVKDFVLTLLSQADQTGADIARPMKAGEAVAKGIINNETLAYFMVRTHKFLVAAGLKTEKLRYTSSPLLPLLLLRASFVRGSCDVM
jgi:glycyl-tRNA synthetase